MLGITKTSRASKTPNLLPDDLRERVRAAVESDPGYTVIVGRLAGVREKLASLRHELELHPRPWELTADAIATALVAGEQEPDFSASRESFGLLARRIGAFEAAERRLVDEAARRRAMAANRGFAAAASEIRATLQRGVELCNELKTLFTTFGLLRGVVYSEIGVDLVAALGGGSALFALDQTAHGHTEESNVRQIDTAKNDLARMLAEAVKKMEGE